MSIREFVNPEHTSTRSYYPPPSHPYSADFRSLESLNDFNGDAAYNVWEISDNKASRSRTNPGVYVAEVPCTNNVSCCTTRARCQAMCETTPRCLAIHWYIETDIFGNVSCECYMMDEWDVAQDDEAESSPFVDIRTEYSAVCTGDSLRTFDNGEFSALTVEDGDLEITTVIIEVVDADDGDVPRSQEDVEEFGLDVVDEVLGEEVGEEVAVYHGSSGEDVLYVVVLDEESLPETDAVQAGLDEYTRISTAAGSEHVLNDFSSSQLERETPAEDGERTAQVERETPAEDGERTAQVERETPAEDGERTAQVERETPAEGGERTAQVEREPPAEGGERARRRRLSSSESTTHDVVFVFVGSSNSTVGPRTAAKLLDRLSVLTVDERNGIRPVNLGFGNDVESSLTGAQSWGGAMLAWLLAILWVA